jgi:cytochrome c553
VRKGVDLDPPITILTPGVPTIGEKIEDSRHGWFSDPQPLSETTYLCSYTPTVLPWLDRSWALYVGDRHGNLALVYRDPEISCAEPVPVVARPRPHLLPPSSATVGLPDRASYLPLPARGEGEGGGEARAATPPLPPNPTPLAERGCVSEGADRHTNGPEAVLLMINVYEGLPGIPRGTARYLRIIEDVPRRGVPRGGVITTSGTSIYTVKRILGIVPIDPDGSAYFVVPADRNVYFEVLDERQREIQRMRSVVCLKAGERRACVGCHERPGTAPPNGVGSAFWRAPSRPIPPSFLTSGDSTRNSAFGIDSSFVIRHSSLPTLSYLRDIQPLLNARCVRCHTHDRATNSVILTDDLTDQFTIGYQELLPYLSVANAMRWDNPEDVYQRPPYTYGSKVSRLTQLLEAGHHDVKLADEEWQRLFAWIDANAVYYDRYENASWPNRRIFSGPERKALDEVHSKRCARCHGKSDGRGDTWWLSLAWRDPRQSRMLQAPLAKQAGGWGRCDGAVFASAEDPDYKALLATLSSLHTALKERPREDLLSLRGTAAETQKVELPPPPAPKAKAAIALPEGTVWLSDLKWEKASAGWTPNKDGLPRLDTDIENKPLRLGRRTYPKGIGTHAPSEIVYRLDGPYARFQADIGGAEDRGTVVFQVYGDGKLLFESGLMHGLRDVKFVDVPIVGVRLLRLVVTDAGDGYNSDEANWAAARLLPKGAK